ncbi:hypothetical protein QBC35DRAFT_474407 [Podospora australis]|uniref:Uncharacterized protein n=1 Tax=Podospora australis TaxID=1536484 RepID=A0AAN6WUN0_9PEZI|nr:hypothetical protein QBC35DRAFT_474407 [Podospora australis]
MEIEQKLEREHEWRKGVASMLLVSEKDEVDKQSTGTDMCLHGGHREGISSGHIVRGVMTDLAARYHIHQGGGKGSVEAITTIRGKPARQGFCSSDSCQFRQRFFTNLSVVPMLRKKKTAHREIGCRIGQVFRLPLLFYLLRAVEFGIRRPPVSNYQRFLIPKAESSICIVACVESTVLPGLDLNCRMDRSHEEPSSTFQDETKIGCDGSVAISPGLIAVVCIRGRPNSHKGNKSIKKAAKHIPLNATIEPGLLLLVKQRVDCSWLRKHSPKCHCVDVFDGSPFLGNGIRGVPSLIHGMINPYSTVMYRQLLPCQGIYGVRRTKSQVSLVTEKSNWGTGQALELFADACIALELPPPDQQVAEKEEEASVQRRPTVSSSNMTSQIQGG